MNTLRFLKGSLIGLALLSGSNAFAANRGSLHVTSTEEVVGQTLGAGDYVVRWEGTGPDVELKIMRGNQVVATATARMIPLQSVSANNSVVLEKNGQRPSLSQIFFSGKAVALEILGPSGPVNVSSR